MCFVAWPLPGLVPAFVLFLQSPFGNVEGGVNAAGQGDIVMIRSASDNEQSTVPRAVTAQGSSTNWNALKRVRYEYV